FTQESDFTPDPELGGERLERCGLDPTTHHTQWQRKTSLSRQCVTAERQVVALLWAQPAQHHYSTATSGPGPVHLDHRHRLHSVVGHGDAGTPLECLRQRA